MITTISFDESQWLKEIYALTALRAHIMRSQGKAGLFTPDQRQGLAVALEDAFYNIVARILPFVSEVTSPMRLSDGDGNIEPGDGIYTMTFNLPDDFSAGRGSALERAVGVAVVFEALSLGTIDGDEAISREYAERVDKTVANILDIIRCDESTAVRILSWPD